MVGDRRAGRKDATEVIGVYEPMAKSQDYREAFVNLIVMSCGMLHGLEIKPKQPERQPVARLGAMIIGYGEFVGFKYDDIPRKRLDWYLKAAEENARSLRAYLTHPDLDSYRGSEPNEGDDGNDEP